MASLNKTEVLANIKEDLNINDNLQDTILNRLINKVVDNFKFTYSQEDVEGKYSFIIEDCTIRRFNKRGAESAKQESVEGHTVSYYTQSNEFEDWHTQLLADFANDDEPQKGGIKFL